MSMQSIKRNNFAAWRLQTVALCALMLALGAAQTVRAQSAPGAAPSGDVSSPTTDPLALTIARSLAATQLASQDTLALTLPPLTAGQPLSVSGAVYLSGTDSPLVDQKIAYANGGVSFNAGYRSVGKDATDADLLAYRTGKDATLPDALNQLLAERGQNDLNAELGLAGSQGLKLDYKIDALTNALAGSQGVNQSLSLSKDLNASKFSFLHTIASTASASGKQTTDTDDLKYAYAPSSGVPFNGDAPASRGTGSDSPQGRLGAGENPSHLDFEGEFWSSETHGSASSQDQHQTGEKFTLKDQVAPAVTVTGFYDHEMVATDRTQAKEAFDATIKSEQIHNVALLAEFVRTQQIAQEARAKRILQMTWSMPHFIGVNSAKWVVGLTDQTTEDQALRRDLSIGFESQVPGSYAVPGLAGATLHLEYAGNEIGATPAGVTSNLPCRLHATMHHSRLLRLVSAPKAGKWLTWSVTQQTRTGDQGTMLPAMRDYEVKGVVSPSLSLAYSDRDQIPQDGSARDTKEQKLSVTVSQPHSAQVVAEFVHGADMSNSVTEQSGVSLGYTSPVLSDRSLSFSFGRDRRAMAGGSPQTGTTCKTAFDWHQDDKNLLGLNGALTAWDNHNGSKANAIDASAHLRFERVY